MELSDILDTPSPLIRVNACMYEYMPHMYIFVTALSNIPLIMLCMFPHGLYSLLDYEINLSYLLSYLTLPHFKELFKFNCCFCGLLTLVDFQKALSRHKIALLIWKLQVYSDS